MQRYTRAFVTAVLYESMIRTITTKTVYRLRKKNKIIIIRKKTRAIHFESTNRLVRPLRLVACVRELKLRARARVNTATSAHDR